MCALFVRRLYLWPRFHGAVNAALNADAVGLVELEVPLTPAMQRVQKAIVDVIATCLQVGSYKQTKLFYYYSLSSLLALSYLVLPM
jgi:DNA excision repair protein ERCC-4